MKKFLKIIIVAVMVLGIALSIINFAANDLPANQEPESYDPGLDDCYGPPGSC